MSLVELIARADERALAASGLACVDRCVPLLGGEDETLRPLWAALADDGGAGDDWAKRLERLRGTLAEPGEHVGGAAEEEAASLARRMLAAAPQERSAAGMRVWADACSVASLQIHRLLEPAPDGADGEPARVDAGREGRAEDMPPLVAAELRRQITVLELLTGHGTAGLRQALEVAAEGRRVLRAVVSRRERGRG
ncbi:hypothetical protein TU94_20315 [Streptomyces cyaneogriseus subsp. noncyanogenus]|uniref:Uncharacterized protein n=1 Tax=Streptomyces cyaneogriseus subsp. noncyanogenus TaxID=477245 RepID=A0A0C5FTW3_9ACTN|nr:hypothetical protein [Streptomyces cyaneogriseus]AJP03477.1 hypothetical protein TU94_20315 [Streptomyces cyaneogriseus subsp. noncyanogenus]